MESMAEKAVIRSAQRMAVILSLATVLVVGVAMVAVAWRVLAPQTLAQVVVPGGWGAPVSPGGGQLTILLGLSLISFFGWALILWWTRSMFAALGRGAPDVAVELARRIAAALWVMLAWQILAPALGSVVASWHMPQGQRSVAITLGFGHAGTLLSALIASSMARALAFGVELWRDHKEII